MELILNEKNWAEEALQNASLGKHPNDTFNRLAKYYTELGYNAKETRNMLDIYLLRCNPNASLVSWGCMMDNAVKFAKKYPIVQIDYIEISEKEMDTIRAIPAIQNQRLAFTLLCVAKYWYAVRPSTQYWVNSEDSSVMRMANINTSVRRQSAMFRDLRERGLIEFSKRVDNLRVHVMFVQDGETVLRVSDFRSLGNQYLMYCGQPYFECVSCGIVTKCRDGGRGRIKKYCPECAAKAIARQRAEYESRNRVSMSV